MQFNKHMQLNKPVLVSLYSFFFASILLATPSWEKLGGSFQGNPFAVFGYDGRVEVFVRGTDNALWFAAQTSPGGSWTPFVSLGGVITSNPTAVVDSTGHIAAFAVGGDTAVWTRSQITAGIDNYSDWTSIGGSSTSDLAVVQTPPVDNEVPTAYLFIRGPDNALWYNRANEASGPWGTSWTSLGGNLASAPGAGANVNGQATVFVRGGDHALWYRQAEFPGTTIFNDWATLGGAMSGPARVAEINNQYVMYRGMDNAAWFILDTTPPVGGGNVAPATWSAPASLGGYILSNPTMAPSLDGDLEVFVVGGDTALYVKAASGIGSPFGPWQSLGGSIVGDPFAVRNGDGTIDVFVIGADGALWHIRQSTAGSWQ